jgi:hypothetical protein
MQKATNVGHAGRSLALRMGKAEGCKIPATVRQGYQENAGRRGMSAALFFGKNSYKADISNGYMGLQNFFLPYNKKKKNKKSNHEWGDKIPPHSLIFSSISENLKKIPGERIALEIIVCN